ncbi:MAG: hypothetical protein Q9187_004111 [Circinaria calcarea]
MHYPTSVHIRPAENSWALYPNNIASEHPFYDNRRLYSQRLQNDEQRLFSYGESNLEVLLVQKPEDSKRSLLSIRKVHIQDVDSLENMLSILSGQLAIPGQQNRDEIVHRMHSNISGAIL